MSATHPVTQELPLPELWLELRVGELRKSFVLRAGHPRAIVVGSAEDADLRIDPDAAVPVLCHFERVDDRVWVVPGYSASFLFDGHHTNAPCAVVGWATIEFSAIMMEAAVYSENPAPELTEPEDPDDAADSALAPGSPEAHGTEPSAMSGVEFKTVRIVLPDDEACIAEDPASDAGIEMPRASAPTPVPRHQSDFGFKTVRLVLPELERADTEYRPADDALAAPPQSTAGGSALLAATAPPIGNATSVVPAPCRIVAPLKTQRFVTSTEVTAAQSIGHRTRDASPTTAPVAAVVSDASVQHLERAPRKVPAAATLRPRVDASTVPTKRGSRRSAVTPADASLDLSLDRFIEPSLVARLGILTLRRPRTVAAGALLCALMLALALLGIANAIDLERSNLETGTSQRKAR